MKPLSQINVIPFIDIMLVLLAVVLTTATFVAQGRIPVTLPSAERAAPLPAEARLEITIDGSGQAFLAAEPVALARLAERLAAVDPGTQVLLRVDQATPFRHFVAVVDLLKGRGLEQVSIVTQRGAGG